jgi:hypothetical protein
MMQLCFALVAVKQWAADTDLPARCCGVKPASDDSCFKQTTFVLGCYFRDMSPNIRASFVESVLKFEDIFMKIVW